MSCKLIARAMFVMALANPGCMAKPPAPQAAGGAGQGTSGQGLAGQSDAGQSLAGQGAAGDAGSSAGDVSFASSVEPFITKACNCHQSTPLMAPFSLKIGEAYANLVDVPSQQLPSMMRVKPGSTSASYLWHKINGTQAQVGGSGMIMPYTFPLNVDEKAIFERWIAAGAPR
jgi:hypothetical protein